MFADQVHAANDVPSGPNPDAPALTDLVSLRLSGTEHAAPTDPVGKAALPPSEHHPLPPAHYRPQPPPVQRSSNLVNGRPPPPPGCYYSDSPYPEPSLHKARSRQSPEADGQGRNDSSATMPLTATACREDHPQQNSITSFDPGGGRGLSSSTSEPVDRRVADLEHKSAFYRNATPRVPGPYAWKPLDLPSFDGDIRKYPRFREAFEEVYGSNPDLAPRNKLLYLRMHLRGEPLAFAETYMVTDDSYAAVLEQLDLKYGDKSTLLVTLCHDLSNIKPPSEELSDLRRFCQEVGAIQSSFRLAGETLDNSPMYGMQIAAKLPKSLRLKLIDSYGYRAYSYNTTALLDGLKKYAANLEWACKGPRLAAQPTDDTPLHSADEDDTSDPSDRPCREDSEFPATEPAVVTQRTPAAVATTIADEQLQERRTCPLCGLLHSAADCTVYETTNRRLRRALKLNLCLLCLREGHQAVSCPRRTTRPCNVCRRGQHNRALCKGAADENHARDRRPSPVRAYRDSRSDPKASDQQRHSRTSAPAKLMYRIAEQPVNREATCSVATATILRQSGTQSSRERISGNLINRKKRPKELGTAPAGRTGTNRPPTTSTDESMKQNGADAHGRDRLLPERDNLLQTDRCSTNRETTQFDRTPRDGFDGVPSGIPDEKGSRELRDEDVSHKLSDGHGSDFRTDASLDEPEETRFHPFEESNVYLACASDSGEQPAVLHECLAVTAMNPASKKSCQAVLMFDSGSDTSHVSSKLAHALDLPRTETRVRNVSTFGSKTPMALKGFRTFLVLRSAQGRCLKVNVTVIDCIASSVRTALVRDADLPALRRSECTRTPTREMPDLLIGQDLVHLFDHFTEPALPSGFYIAQTSMGSAIGGASRLLAPSPEATTSSSPPAALPAAEDTDISMDSLRCSRSLSPSKPDPSSSRLQPRPKELSTGQPTDLVGSQADSFPDRPVCFPTDLVGGTAVHVSHEHLEPSTSTIYSLRKLSPLPQVSGALPRSSQKQLSQTPLDTQLLLLPTNSTTYVEVEEVSAANLATRPPRPIQKQLSSTEAEIRCSTPPPPPHGDLIRAPFYDAGSPNQRKTRLRLRVPDYNWQHLGTYAAPEPVVMGTMLLSSDSTFMCFPRAQKEPQLVPMSSPSSQITSTLPHKPSRCLRKLLLQAVRLPDAGIGDHTLRYSTASLAALGHLDQMPPPITMSTGQSDTGPSDLAGPVATAPATMDDSVPTDLVGRKSPEPQAIGHQPQILYAYAESLLQTKTPERVQKPIFLFSCQTSFLPIPATQDLLIACSVPIFPALLLDLQDFSEAATMLFAHCQSRQHIFGTREPWLRRKNQTAVCTSFLRTFERYGSHHEIFRRLRSFRGLLTHASQHFSEPAIDSAHQRPPRDAHRSDAADLQPAPAPACPQPPGRTQPLPHSILARAPIDPYPTLQCLFDPIAHKPLCRVLPCPVPVAYFSGSCSTSPSLASTRSTMARRKQPKNAQITCSGAEHSTTVQADNVTRRLIDRQEGQHMPTNTFAADLARAHLQTDHNQDYDEPVDTSHGASRPADLAGLEASQTASATHGAAPLVFPTDLVGARSDARRDRHITSAAYDAKHHFSVNNQPSFRQPEEEALVVHI